MEKGDLSNDAPPRVLVVANDFLVKQPPGTWIDSRGFGKMRRQVERLELDPDVRAWLHDFTWRRHMRVDIVVIGIAPERWTQALHDRLDRLNLSIAQVYAVRDLKELVSSLAYMPEVLYVVHGNPEWQLAFGPRGICGASSMGSV